MKDLVIGAILRLLIYFAPVIFGGVGAIIAALGLGLYNAETQTITMTLSQFIAAITVMVGSGGTAILAVVKGWRTRKAASP